MGSDKKNNARKRQKISAGQSANGPKPEKLKRRTDKGKGNSRTSVSTIFYILPVLIIAVSITAFYYEDIRQLLDETFQKKPSAETPEVLPTERDEKPPSQPSESASEEKAASTEKQAKNSYSKANVTNSYDDKIHSLLDSADELLKKNKIPEAIQKYNDILQKYSKSGRARLGLADALAQEAERKKSNKILEDSIQEYIKVADVPEVSLALLKDAIRRGVEKMHFRGWSTKAAQFLRRLVEKYPDDIEMYNTLGVCYLMSGRVEHARETFKKALDLSPTSGFALVHYGFILKTADDNSINAIPYLQTGIESEEPGTDDGRFYFHLGDALNRVGRKEESYEVYEKGAKRGHFLSKYQRSLYNVETLTGRPWWTPSQTTYEKQMKLLEENWKTIRDEGLAQMDQERGGFKPEEENLREKGDWKQYTLWARGKKHEHNCRKTPKTCALLEKIPEAAGCTRGQIKYSVMQPGVHVWPHCGPTNCRIRAHLGLVVPPGPRIRVAEKEGKWKEGKFIIFDDSFEHEVWHEGDSFRLVLIVDFWHPEVTPHQKVTLSPI